MPNKASLAININVGNQNAAGSYQGSYSGTGSASGSGVTAPSVDSGGDITVYEDTNVTFSLQTAGFTFPTSGTLITIGGTNYSAGSSGSTFSIGSNQPTNNNKDLELEDEDIDGNSSGVSHQYNLYVVTGGNTYTLDPNFYNKK